MKKLIFPKLLLIVTLFFIFLQIPLNSAHAACAVDGNCDYKTGEDIFNCKADCLGPGIPTKSPVDVLGDAINWLLGFAAAVCVIMIVIGGVYYVSSTGDQQQAQTGKNILKYAILGLVVVGVSYALIVVVSTIVT